MKKILLISLVIIAACSAKKQTVKNEINSNEPLKIEISNSENDNISFVVKNTLNESVYLIQSERLHIEKHLDEKWEKLRILPCPCDAPCTKPEERRELYSKESLTFKWNKEESWCGDQKENHIRNTERRLVEKGKYRVRFRYLLNENKIKNIYKEFNIN